MFVRHARRGIRLCEYPKSCHPRAAASFRQTTSTPWPTKLRPPSLPRIGIHRHAVGCCSAEAMVTAYLNLYRTTIDESNENP